MVGKEQVQEARTRVSTLTLVKALSKEQRCFDFHLCFHENFEFSPKTCKAKISGF